MRTLTLVDEKTPQTVEHRKHSHSEQLQKSKDLRFNLYITGAFKVVRFLLPRSAIFMILVFIYYTLKTEAVSLQDLNYTLR